MGKVERTPLLVAVLLVSMLSAACGNSQGARTADTGQPTPSVPESTSSAEADIGLGDLDQIDAIVRERHLDPFSVVSEAAWSARLAAVKASFPTADPDERIVGMASLAGLLDTHTQFWSPDQVMYEVLLYRFSDGVFVVAARDPAMIGWRLDAISSTPVADVEALMQPLIPADNESAYLNAVYLTAYVDYLHGLGIVADPAKPGFVFSKPDGAHVTVDLGIADADDFFESQHAMGSLAGDANEAVRRRSEPIWWRVDEATGSFLLSLNEHSSAGRIEAVAAMTEALDTGAADHVVVDMRNLRGGDGSQLLPVVDALESDTRINTPGGLTVLIGRENESAATVIASKIEARTAARFLGEMTPARADNFLCPCEEDPLPGSGYVFSVPSSRSGNGDDRMAIEPDVVITLSSIEYFSGRDPALDLALAG